MAIASHQGPGSMYEIQTDAPPKTLKNATIYFKADGPYAQLPNGTKFPIYLTNVGPGPGTYGGGSLFVNSLTIGADGRVLAITTGSAGGGGGGGGGWSFVDAALGSVADGDGYVAGITGGSATVGGKFKVTAPCHIVGARVYWSGGFSTTLKVSIWDPTGTRVATANVAVTTAGVYSVTFGSSVAVLSANVMRNYIVSYWDTSGNGYTHATGAGYLLVPGKVDLNGASCMVPASSMLVWSSVGIFVSGDAKPTTNFTGELIPIDVTLTVP